MGGQVTRHGHLINGPVPITSLPSGSLRHKHSYDCSVPITSQSPSSELHHHFEPIDCPSHVTSLRHNKHVRLSSHQPWLPNQDPLLFHPTVKGSQIVMDESQRIVRRRGSFCNAIVFSDRSLGVNEVVRLKITHTHHAWQGALRIGFTTQDPSMMHPKSLPRYSCPDLASKSGFWAKPLPEELLNTESVISFWISKKGRVLYRINDGTSKRLFRQVSSYLPLWVFVDVYGKTKGVQLLDSETLPQNGSIGSTRSRLTFPKKTKKNSQIPVHLWNMFEDDPEEDDRDEPQCVDHMPQNSQNLRLCSELPEHLDDELRFHHVHGEHIRLEDHHTAVTLKHLGPDRTLVFTSRPLEQSESVFVMVHTAGPAELSYGVTACNPATLRPKDLPTDMVWLLDRMEFWAVDNLSAQLSNEDILGFELNAAAEVVVSRNGNSLGVQLCVDNSRPLWMFFMPHKNVAQLKIFGLSSHSDVQGPPRSPVVAVPSLPASPLSATNITSSRLVPSRQPSTALDQLVQPRLRPRQSAIATPSAILSSQRSYRFSTDTEQNPTPSSPSSVGPPQASDECAICCDDTADTVLYDCGHLCLCYRCALKLKQVKAPCPMCRKPILDIIRTYKSS
ncbi:neuralized E3 ubiquitin protein ligase 1Ab [Syngnathus typhle]|uniref:neuralized E3 ubiquitin protein ligase 1Ab n=1 Tax=Syngnathus typhle TaxID=161592 RepID=UPI002A6A6504|nr:neuralized E3 ubiquitin protein ligase 1Ab [Syngnathus typhle]